MSTRRSRFWSLAIVISCLIVASWLMLQHQQPAAQRVATPTEPTEPSEPATELADDSPEPPPPTTHPADEPSPPRAEAPQPSAAEAPTAESTPPATIFENTPRKRAAEPVRLHFAHSPETRTPGLGLSKAACDELRERQQRAESLSDRELLHLKLDCRGR